MGCLHVHGPVERLGFQAPFYPTAFTLTFTHPHLGDVPRDGGPDELGELVVVDTTPLGIIAVFVRFVFRFVVRFVVPLLRVCHGTENEDATVKCAATGRGNENAGTTRPAVGLLAT